MIKNIISIKLNEIQFVLFKSGLAIPDKLKVASEINSASNGIFDGDPLIVPLPEDAPQDIPRFILSSRDKKKRLQVSLSRIDNFYSLETDFQNIDFANVLTVFLSIEDYFSKFISGNNVRIALVSKWLIELSKNGAGYVLEKYLHSNVLIKNPLELEVHYLTKESISSCEVNRWVRIKSSRKIERPEQDNFLNVIIDINTLPEKDYEFDPKLLRNFFDDSFSKSRGVINEHFVD